MKTRLIIASFAALLSTPTLAEVPMPDRGTSAYERVVRVVETMGMVTAASDGNCANMKENLRAIVSHALDQGVSMAHVSRLNASKEGQDIFAEAYKKVRANPRAYCPTLWSLYGPGGSLIPGALQPLD